MSENTFLNSLAKRRSVYAIGRNTDVSEEVMAETIQQAVKLSPSAFNSQTSRALILFGDANQKLWAIVKAELKAEMDRQGVPEEAWNNTEAKLNSFAAGVGTALMFEDVDIVKNLQNQFPLYADNFPIWSEQSTGIATVNAWVALSELGLGANLQHYNPVIDEAVAKEWNLPSQWKLRGQLVFGSVETPAGEKEFMNDADRFKVVK
ncbi:hypothetical protein SAMN02745116_01041 [Pilibacter termitis]|uniref:Nitroreductase domain-containing protein n=1 Tax=Pilibacter termitis TaxID=263852 RepID=A0A1T4MCB8_9ENTE|nr:nitroreductase family protein [Pilibacter termitis]SJZ64511.1 hypothetical protein SAMN02745116_01041 [Pilibacter termitis]